ncbi:MAG: hypothetical protein IEMM0002_0364 [bacterium]|nr:MAG: hypothetical protein IEMM0002_0364 [bacterium]
MRKAIIIALVAVVFTGCAGDQRIRRHKAGGYKKIYVVKKGDNLTRIAARFGVNAASIKRANNLKLDIIVEGQRLTIPPKSSRKAVGKSGARKKNRYSKKYNVKKKVTYYAKKPPKIDVTLRWPLKNGTVTSRFGVRKSGKHDGMDIGAPKGAKILSAADGKVVFSGRGPTGYGLLVVIKHSEKVYTVYSHNSKNIVKKGERIKRSSVVALVGHSGRATNNHLHFEVRVNRVAYDPLAYLPARK